MEKKAFYDVFIVLINLYMFSEEHQYNSTTAVFIMQ